MILTEEQEQKLARAQEILDYRFDSEHLLLSAITHPSATEGKSVKYSYERLEFLGDSILGAIVAAIAFHRFHDLDEGGLTRIKVALVSLDMAREPENPKSALQEKLQEDGITPTYKLVETQGPPHDRTFVAQVFAGTQGLARGTGRTKKEAESQAAKSTLARLGEFFGLGVDEETRAEKAEAAKLAKAEKAAARAEEKARKKSERAQAKQRKQG